MSDIRINKKKITIHAIMFILTVIALILNIMYMPPTFHIIVPTHYSWMTKLSLQQIIDILCIDLMILNIMTLFEE